MSTPKLLESFFSSHIMPHINFPSRVWDGCCGIHLSKLNSLHRREAKSLTPDQNLSTDEKQKAFSILPLQRQLDFNKATLMFKVKRRMVPSYMTSLCSECNKRTIRHILPKPCIDLHKTSLVFFETFCLEYSTHSH